MRQLLLFLKYSDAGAETERAIHWEFSAFSARQGMEHLQGLPMELHVHSHSTWAKGSRIFLASFPA